MDSLSIQATSALESARRPAKAAKIALILFAAFAALAAFSPSLLDVWGKWQRPQYSHGPLIPLIAALIFWHDFERSRWRYGPSWYGLPAIALGFTLLILGDLSTFNSASLYGLVAVFSGIILAVFGTGALRAAAPALTYLCFAIPPPDFIYVDGSAALQLLSSSLAVDVLDGLGVPVAQDGNIIDLGLFRLQVAEACSGLRYLFPLASFSFLVAFLLHDRLWKRAVLFLSAVPIAIFLNVGRIVIVGVTVQAWGISAAEGFLHAFEGWLIFITCVALLLGEAALLRGIHKFAGSRFRLEYVAMPNMKAWSGGAGLRRPGYAALMLISMSSVAVFGLAKDTSREEPRAAFNAASVTPLSLGPWHGQQQSLDSATLDALELSDYFLARYSEGASAGSVEYYVAYYSRQAIGSAVHSPANCIPGGGWTIVKRSKVLLPVGVAAGHIAANRLLIRSNGVDRLVYYWFAQRGRDLTDEWSVKWYLLRDRLLEGRSDGYLVRLVTTVDDADETAADQRMQRLLAAAQPYLPS